MSTLFISDLHLDASRPAITAQFLHFLDSDARTADGLYILGDLFESWIGDDAPDADQCAAIGRLRALTDGGVPCFVMHGNRDFLLDFLVRELPGIRVDAPIEATYLAWLNVGDLGVADPAAHFEAHGVGLSDGAMFGAAPGQAVRLNFGCPRATLAEALRRMKTALPAKG